MKALARSVVAAAVLGLVAASGQAGVGPEVAQKLYERVTPSLVAVQFTWESELGRRELVGAGVIVSADGVVAAPLGVLNPGIPDAQMKEFKVIVPRTDGDDEELDATFLGRDERAALGFVKINEKREWKAVKFEDTPVRIGEPVFSVGLLPKGAGYRSYFMEGAVSARLRGEMQMVLAALGFVKINEKREWKAVKFEDTPVRIGEPVFSFGCRGRAGERKPRVVESKNPR